MVAIDIASTVVAVPTSGATFDVTISGIGTPKGVKYEWVGVTTDIVPVNEARFSSGYSDEAGAQRCGVLYSEDGSASSATDTGYRYHANAVAVMTATTTEAELARLSWNSYITDGVRLNIDLAAASALLLRVTFFFGDDWTSEIVEYEGASVQGNSIDYEPSIPLDILLVSSVYVTAAVSTSGANSRMAVGWAARRPSITQGGFTTTDEDRPAGNTNLASRIYDDALISRITATAGGTADTARHKITAWTDSAITIETQNASNQFVVFGLGLGCKGRWAWAGIPDPATLDTTSTGDRTFNEPNMRGAWAFGIASMLLSKNSMGTGSLTGKFSVGFSDANDQGCVAVQVADNVGTGNAHSFSDDSFFLEPINDSSLPDFKATLTAFTATGVTINIPTLFNSGSDRVALFLVITDAPVLYPAGIASGSAFGTPTVTQTGGAVTLSPGGIVSGSAFGLPAVFQGFTLLPDGIASASTFGTPAIVRGAVTLSPGGIPSGSAFGLPALIATIILSPDGIASVSAFGTPSLVAGAVILSPGGIATGSAFGLPALAATIVLSPGGIASGSTFGTPSIVAGTVTLSPGGVASGSAFGLPIVTIVGAGVLLSPNGIASSSAFGLPFVTGGVIPITMKKRIHDALCERAYLGTFIAATYPVDDEGCVLEQGIQVQPRSVEVNELKGSFLTEHRHGRELILDRSRWLWLMIVRFDQEVVAELFERALEDAPVVVCRDPADPASRQARLSRVDCDYDHPPRGNPSNGTELRYRFEATLSPK